MDGTQLRQRIKEILRRDLKLGSSWDPAADDPLFSADTDLDSLDMLLVVSSLEREFGFKIPSQDVGQAIFATIEVLTDYVQAHALAAPKSPAAVAVRTGDPLEQLPHAPPFRFVDTLTSLKPEDSAEGVWQITGSEAFFAGHFPGNPIVPGVLIAEALAQLSGLIAPPPGATAGKLAHVDVRFDRPVIPPAAVVLQSRLIRKVVSLQQFEVTASVDGTAVARGTLAIQHTA